MPLEGELLRRLAAAVKGRRRTGFVQVQPFILALSVTGALLIVLTGFLWTRSTTAPSPTAELASHTDQVHARPATATPMAQPTVAAPPDERARQIREFLAGRPLAEYADEMVAASDRHRIDWRYLPVLSFLESGGGVAACGGNAWGYAACDIVFADYLAGMERVAAALAAYPYAGRSVATVLCIWQSGGGCTTQPAVAYAYLGAPYFDLLGEAIALPPQLASQPAATAEPPGTAAVVTPAPDATPIVGGTPRPGATQQPITPEATPSAASPTTTPPPTGAAVGAG